MTGSSSLGLLDAEADTLAGRIAIQALPPACWGENQGPPTHAILTEKASPLQMRQGNRLLQQAMTHACFPKSLPAKPKRKKRSY